MNLQTNHPLWLWEAGEGSILDANTSGVVPVALALPVVIVNQSHLIAE